ncbi:MAG: N-acetylneuraminate synthase family protein [bacterium]|nr:N-acetylneuraminate synthase family protein [bacterium]
MKVIHFPDKFLMRSMRFIKHVITGSPFPSTQDVCIGSTPVGRGKPCFFIAEIGINHNGSVETACALIDAAHDAGAQAVKFQKRTVKVVYSPEELRKPRVVDKSILNNAMRRNILSEDAMVRLTASDCAASTNGDLKWALEFTAEEYKKLFLYAKTKDLLCFASPWDLESVDFLEQFDPPCHKIASAMLTNRGLLKKVRATGRPVILSTGMSTMEEIHEAVRILGSSNLILLHTVSTYPSDDRELNLRLITKLRQEFPTIPIGYSGHEKGLIPSLCAVSLGAHVIERHITLDRTMPGSDQGASLTPNEFAKLVADTRLFESSVGDGIKSILASEVPIREKLSRLV